MRLAWRVGILSVLACCLLSFTGSEAKMNGLCESACLAGKNDCVSSANQQKSFCDSYADQEYATFMSLVEAEYASCKEGCGGPWANVSGPCMLHCGLEYTDWKNTLTEERDEAKAQCRREWDEDLASCNVQYNECMAGCPTP